MVRIGLRNTLAIALLVLSAMCSTVVGDEEYILWDYSAYTTNQVGIFESNPGYVYMVVDIELENHGYSEFDVNPYYFEAVVNKVQYACDAATFDTSINTLPLVTLQDGGAVSGQLVYQIAEGSTEYSIEYAGYTWMDYNFVKP